jgi:putative ABC transport system substrate-binding protein
MLGAKRLEMLRELVPGAKTIGVLMNPQNSASRADTEELQAAVVAGRQRLVAIAAAPKDNLAAALDSARQQKIEALIVTADPPHPTNAAERQKVLARAPSTRDPKRPSAAGR